MSHSYRTDPKWRIADRNAKRDQDGRVLLPRIVERSPRIGDIHPLPKAILARLLSRLPVELYYGLQLIEMQPRQDEIGCPFAFYSQTSKTIRLFSLPLALHLPCISPRQSQLFAITKANIEQNSDGFTISWADSFSMGFWFYYDVFVHELGHHHRFQYPSKAGKPGRRSEEEFMADRYGYWATIGRLSPKKYARPV